MDAETGQLVKLVAAHAAEIKSRIAPDAEVMIIIRNDRCRGGAQALVSTITNRDERIVFLERAAEVIRTEDIDEDGFISYSDTTPMPKAGDA